MKKKPKLPAGWNEARIQGVLSHYENQTDEEAVAEDETAWKSGATVMRVPRELVPAVRAMIAKKGMQTPRKKVTVTRGKRAG